MAEEKSSKAKKDPDSKKTGNSCGFSIGCFIIIAAVAVVTFFLFIKPALEDAGYSCDDLKNKIFDLKNKANSVIDKTDEIYKGSKEKYQEIKDKTDNNIDDLKEINGGVQEDLDKSAPKLIAD